MCPAPRHVPAPASASVHRGGVPSTDVVAAAAAAEAAAAAAAESSAAAPEGAVVSSPRP